MKEEENKKAKKVGKCKEMGIKISLVFLSSPKNPRINRSFCSIIIEVFFRRFLQFFSEFTPRPLARSDDLPFSVPRPPSRLTSRSVRFKGGKKTRVGQHEATPEGIPLGQWGSQRVKGSQVEISTTQTRFHDGLKIFYNYAVDRK